MAAARRPAWAEHHRAGAQPEYGQEPDLAVAEAAPELCEVYFPGEYGRVVLEMGDAKPAGRFNLVVIVEQSQLDPKEETFVLSSADAAIVRELSIEPAVEPNDEVATTKLEFLDLPRRRRTYALESIRGESRTLLFQDMTGEDLATLYSQPRQSLIQPISQQTLTEAEDSAPASSA